MMKVREEITNVIRRYLASGKINALLTRTAARDLYDMNNMVRFDLFDELESFLLRKCILFYLTISSDEVLDTYLTRLLVISDSECRYLEAFRSGEYRPELLFSGDELARVVNHSMALWKMQNHK